MVSCLTSATLSEPCHCCEAIVHASRLHSILVQVQGDALLVANAGDSRCVVSEAGKAVAMSYDHKPTDAAEHSRIIKVSSTQHGLCLSL